MWLLQRAVLSTMWHTTWLSAITLLLLCTGTRADECPNIGNTGAQTESGEECFLPFFFASYWHAGCSPNTATNVKFCFIKRADASGNGKCMPQVTEPITTDTGSPCVFPFDHQGARYYTCTTAGRGRPWCQTMDGGWSFCTNIVDCDDQGGNCTVHIRYRDQCAFPPRLAALVSPVCNQQQCDSSYTGAAMGKIECKNYCFATGIPAPKRGRPGPGYTGNGAPPKQIGPDPITTTPEPTTATTGTGTVPPMTTTRAATATSGSSTTATTDVAASQSPTTADPSAATAVNPSPTTAGTGITTPPTTTESASPTTTTAEVTTKTPSCPSNPCLNGGTCQETLTGFVCACPSNFTGHLCQKPIFCVMKPCQNHGVCSELNYPAVGFRCACVGGFQGQTCENFGGVSDAQHYRLGIRLNQVYIIFNSIIGQQILGDLKPQIQQRIGSIDGVLGFVILGYGNDSSSLVVYLTIDIKSSLCAQKKALVLDEVAKALTSPAYTIQGQSVPTLGPITVYVNDGSNVPVKVLLVPGAVCAYYTGAKLCPTDCPQCVVTDGKPYCECADGTSKPLCDSQGGGFNRMYMIIIIVVIILLLLILCAVIIYFKCRRHEEKVPPYEYVQEDTCAGSNCGHGPRYTTSYISDMPLKHYI